MHLRNKIKKQGLYDPQYEHDACGVGFVCNIDGKQTNTIILQGLEVLERMVHRGAVGSDPLTGDGAGILMQIPDVFIRKICKKSRIALPELGRYGMGLIFLPQNKKERLACEKIFKDCVEKEGATFLGWRNVPVDNSVIGITAKKSEPKIKHAFISIPKQVTNADAIERMLYIIRRQIEKKVLQLKLNQQSFFYISNLSAKTLVYKGLLMPEQVRTFFKDLSDPDITSSMALVHSRFSTNTLPSWDLAQPFRCLAHNGEINTLRGNVNWMTARESQLGNKKYGKNIRKILPVITPGGSDSAALDNELEFLVRSGRSFNHAITMLVPDSWNAFNPITDELRAYYEYHASFMEPWDGPACLCYMNGDQIGASLDRNGLRPARYIITKDGFCVVASEVGVLDIPAERVKEKGRLSPGKSLWIDTTKNTIIFDKDIKKELSLAHPYRTWLREHKVDLQDITPKKTIRDTFKDDTLLQLQRAFGYTREELKLLLNPMASTGVESTGAMGNDAPLAIFSEKSPLLFNYFKQLFAQVTNPPIDSYRETLVMSLVSFIGCQKNLIDSTPQHCHMLRINSPILTDAEFQAIAQITTKGFKSATIDITFDATKTGSLKKALTEINKKAAALVRTGHTFIILSDRNVSAQKAAIPSLLATGSVHHHLVRNNLRTQTGLIIETGEAREVTHFGLLLGYGASAIHPYLAYATLKQMHQKKTLDTSAPYETIESNYIKSIGNGLLKIFSKMGISTIRSYRGAQIYEAVGLNSSVIKEYFTGTSSRVEGATLQTLERETLLRHHDGFANDTRSPLLSLGGQYRELKKGERHSWNAKAITSLQEATSKNDQAKYNEFAAHINDQDKALFHLRGMLKFKKGKSVPLSQVESAKNIVKRFVTGAMSYGSISKEAHEAMAIAMNRLGGKSNSGEGGEDPLRFTPLPNGDSKRSAIKQVASGRFGVTSNYLTNADEIQIKIAQGAKPGEGGQLPGHKVNEIIAKTRYSTPGVTLISPPPHHDIYSIEDLAQLIYDLKNANPKARISVKLVAEIGVGTIAAGVAKGHADMILISGHDGGTGASPRSSIKHAGLPWELGLAETHQTLVLNDLRGRTRLQTDGQLRTGRDVAIAALLGAEEYGFATAALVVLGCVMMRKCNLNTCPVGVATQDPMLRKKFKGKATYLENYFYFIAEELRAIMAELGFQKIDDMIGRVDMLEANEAITFWKTKDIDLSSLLFKPVMPKHIATHCVTKQDHNISRVLDKKLIKQTENAWKKKQPVIIHAKIKNTDRTVGAMLSNTISQNWGEDGLPEDTITVKFTGSAGQSFGAFLAKGVTFSLKGDCNDYVGKGLSGGRIIISPEDTATYKPEENIIAGNVLFYGATRGEAYINGCVGERFCIRNSGAHAVVEGVGDHGCEYMTGGCVLILGSVGRNFAAGMSGGIAYVYNEGGNFDYFCNQSMVDLEEPTRDDENIIHTMLHKHVAYTGSTKAQGMLDNFMVDVKKFVKVFPKEYKRVLAARAASKINEE